jgi:hypothetical protein
MGGRVGSREEEAMSSSLAGLSREFDSTVATMRLAALTASSEDVDELSKTFKIPRPTAEEIINAAPLAKAARAVERKSKAQPSTQPSDVNLLLFIILLMILLGMVSFFFF